MADYKGTGVVFMRNYIKGFGEAAGNQVVSQLTPDEAFAFHKTMAVTWVPVEFITRLFVVAAEVLFPRDGNGLRHIGRAMALDNIKGIYKVIFRVLTIPFIIEQSSKGWRLYHGKGEASAQAYTDKHMAFVVKGYPELPKDFRECLCGYIIGTIELTGQKNIQVMRGDQDPNAWRWDITWE